MPKVFSGREIAKILSKKYGFEEISIRGSHLKMRKIECGQKITVIIPLHKEIKTGTLFNILKQAKINRMNFVKY